MLTDKPKQFKLKIRHPRWVRAGALAFKLGDQAWVSDSPSSSYATVERLWQNGDRLEVTLPMHTTIEVMPNVPDYVAVLHGPIMLAARTGTEDLKGLVADDTRWAHIAHGALLPLDEAPMLVGDQASIPDKVTPLPGRPLQFQAQALIRPDTCRNLVLEPFFRVHDSRYMMYWRTASPEQYQAIRAAVKAAQEQKLRLDRITLDRVVPGEQQPEADHNLQHQGSESGVYRGRHLRHVRAPGWFSYDLRVDPGKALSIYVLCWGRERGRRTFDILVDGQRLVTENTVGKWNKNDFVAVQYALPEKWIAEKTQVTIRFLPHPGHTAGGLFDLRIIQVEE